MLFISQEATYRRKIVLYSICKRRNGFWGYFLFFINIEGMLLKIEKKAKNVIALFSGGAHISEMAHHEIWVFDSN